MRACAYGFVGMVALAVSGCAGGSNRGLAGGIPSAASLERRCDDHDMPACVALGACCEHGKCGLSADPRRAGELYQKACDGGNALGCSYLGNCYGGGRCGMPQSLPLASRWHRKACEGGDGQACSNLGVCYQKGDCGFAPDAQQAGQLYQKACDRGSGDGCRNLGVCYHIGACGVTRDDERAVQLVRKACEQGAANACSALRAAAESTSAGPQLPAPASGSLIGAWKWNGDVTLLRADGTGTYYRDGSVCHEFRYVLQGDQYSVTADRDSQCSGSRQNSYRYRTENDVVVLTHIGSGFESRWRRTSSP